VKAIPTLALFAALSLAVAGCGSGKRRAASDPITVEGTTTISDVQTGSVITCRGGPGA